MSERLRARLARLTPPWPDAVLALAFTVVAVVLAVWFRQHTGDGSVRLQVDVAARPRPIGVYPVKPFVVSEPSGPTWQAVVRLALLFTVPLAWRRRLPLAALVVQFVGVFTVDDIGWAEFLAVLLGAYSLARYGRSPLLSLGALLAAAGLVAATFQNSTPDLPGWLAPFVILIPIGLAGTAIRSARARADALAGRAALLEREQEAATRAAVADERARIARELHDVVSHHVSVMTIQAGAAGRVLDDHPDLARNAIGAIEASGREAMGELRHLLGLLATGAGTGMDPVDALRPQPGLAQLDALVDAVRAVGQPVTARTCAVALPSGVDLAAYRVIQEALTNALRYAPGARTEVVVDRDGDVLVIEVTDEGVPAPAGVGIPVGVGIPGGAGNLDGTGTAAGAGTGLVGLAERLGLYRGTLEAGRRIGGGFRVLARIPLEPA